MTEALIVAEHSPAEPLDEVPFLERADRRKYGGTLISFFQRNPRTNKEEKEAT